MVIELCICGTGVGMVVPDGLKARYGIREDTYPAVHNERCKRRMYSDQFCSHDGGGLFRSRGIYVDGSVGGNVHHRRP